MVEVIGLIPGGYEPIFARALEGYCVKVAFRDRIARDLERPNISTGERRILRRLLKEENRLVFEVAEMMGLTPRSRLQILRKIKRAQ
jgi:hypothetical protein